MRSLCIYILLFIFYSCNSNEVNIDNIETGYHDGLEIIYHEEEGYTQILLEDKSGKGEGIFSCDQPKDSISVEWINSDTLTIKYPFGSFIEQKKTSTTFFGSTIIIIYLPYLTTGNLDIVYKEYWCKEEFINLEDYESQVNKTTFTFEFLATLSDDCAHDTSFYRTFQLNLLILLEKNPALFISVINENELLRKDLILESLDTEITEFNYVSLIDKIENLNSFLYVTETELKEKILSRLKN